MFLFFEAFHLANSIFDTNDLNTVRGSSMALEQLGEKAAEHFGMVLRRGGGSVALLHSDQPPDDIEALIETFLKSEPFKYFTITWGLSNDQDEARRIAKFRQMQQWSVPLLIGEEASVEDLHAVDPLDRMRPARVKEFGPEGARMLSASVKCRRDIGKQARPELFQRSAWMPPQSFEDIVRSRHSEEIPFVVQNKLAVVKADGIGFGTLGRQNGSEFTTRLEDFRKKLARRIEDWAGERKLWYADQLEGQDILRHRVDVLVWGGDDMTFVLPASHLLDFLSKFFDVTGEAGLPHRVGCVVAQYKTPIRKLTAMAEQAEAEIKGALVSRGEPARDAFTIDIFEAAAVSFSGPQQYRRELYGDSYEFGDDLFLAGDVDRIMRHVQSGLSKNPTAAAPLSITQMHRVLQRLQGRSREYPGRIPNNLPDKIAKRVEKAVSRSRSVWAEHVRRVRQCEPDFEGLEVALSTLPRLLPLYLAQLTQLYPYVQSSLSAQREGQAEKQDATV